MIIGIGTDLLDIRRIERTLKRFGERFVARIFTATERARAYGRVNPAAAFAQRYAAKEACAKALGTGLRQGVFWRDMAVEDLPSGKPLMVLTGGARKRLDALTPAGMKAQVDVTLSDEYPMAQAMVVISAVPAAPGGKRGVSPRQRYAGDAPAAPAGKRRVSPRQRYAGDAPAAPGGKRRVSPRQRYAGDAPTAPGQAP